MFSMCLCELCSGFHLQSDNVRCWLTDDSKLAVSVSVSMDGECINVVFIACSAEVDASLNTRNFNEKQLFLSSPS